MVGVDGIDDDDEAMVALFSAAVFFDGCLRANDSLKVGDKMGIFSYVARPDLMACAQTRRRGRSSLKCKLDAR